MRTLGLGAWLRLALLAGLLLGGVVAIRGTGVPDVDRLRGSLTGTGLAGLLVFVAAYLVCSLLVLPKGVLSAGAGLVWGFGPGVAVVLVGALLGAGAAFWLGRWLGRDSVTQLLGTHLDRLNNLVDRHGVSAILVVRLVPVVPFTAVNYAAGLTSIGFEAFLLGTAVGIIPGTAAYVALGAYGTDPHSWEFAAAVVVFAVLTLGGGIAVRRRRGRCVDRPDAPSPIDRAA